MIDIVPIEGNQGRARGVDRERLSVLNRAIQQAGHPEIEVVSPGGGDLEADDLKRLLSSETDGVHAIVEGHIRRAHDAVVEPGAGIVGAVQIEKIVGPMKPGSSLWDRFIRTLKEVECDQLGGSGARQG
jgi:hypothetical protein